jgi:threonine dehydrogenase-like Zn-dependent dehydrogenase
MQAVVYRGRNKVRVENVPDPKIQEPRDAIVRISLTTICGTDIHLVNGNIPGMKSGTILGHEGVGTIEELGAEVEGLSKGDRVVILSTIACGRCRACIQRHFAHCERTPVGPAPCFFGGPVQAGSIDGTQADLVRVPFADVGCVKIPASLDDVTALAASDILPTALFGLDRIRLAKSEKLVIFGAGPVGQMAIFGAHRLGCSKIVVVDKEPPRLAYAQRFEEVDTVNYSSWFGPIKEILAHLEDEQGADAVLDCVGVDASSEWGFANPKRPIEWAAEVVRPEGSVGLIGVYPDVMKKVPLGTFLDKNAAIVGGVCNHKAFADKALDLLRAHPEEGRKVFTHRADLGEFEDAYEAFVGKEDGMIKCLLVPAHSPVKQEVPAAAAAR